MTRKMADCRATPSEANCSLTITGTEDEVVRAAVQHMVDAHEHEDTDELRAETKASLVDASEGITREGAFVQIIEFQATPHQTEQMKGLADSWRDEIGSARTAGWSVLTKDRDRDDTYVQFVAFPDFEQAMANSEHPATKHFADQMNKLSSGDPTFRNLDVVQVEGEA